jgi:hypothetical protein
LSGGRRLATLLAVLSLPHTAVAGMTPLPPIPADLGGGVRISISSYFNEPPLLGVAPLEVRIENASARAGAWQLRFVSTQQWPHRRLESRHELRVEARSERRFEIYVPLVQGQIASPWIANEVSVAVSGPGTTGEVVQLYRRTVSPSYTHATGVSGSLTPHVAISEGLVVANWEPLNALLGARAYGLVGSRFAVSALPSEWRGYAAFASLWMTEEEWRSASPTARAAILQWVGLGRRLIVASAGGDPPGGLRAGRRGFGEVVIVRRDGDKLADLDAAARAVLEGAHALHQQLGHYSGWTLLAQVEPLVPPLRLMGTVLAGYGLVLAPLNLFVCRRSRRRQILFWSVPLVSLTVACVLAGLILLQDGTGGEGRRYTAIHVDADENVAHVVQEQVARTGMLLSPAFVASESFLIEPIPLGVSIGALAPALDLTIEGARYGGDWFMNRSRQAHFLEALRPTRARVEVETGSGSSLPVTSTFPGTLGRLFVLDRQGGVWSGQDIAAGRRSLLATATRSDFDAWWERAVLHAGARNAALLKPLRSESGYFFAAWKASEGPIETSPGIRFEQEQLLVLGPYLARERR